VRMSRRAVSVPCTHHELADLTTRKVHKCQNAPSKGALASSACRHGKAPVVRRAGAAAQMSTDTMGMSTDTLSGLKLRILM
jgi:hypothetical protein